MKVLHILHSLKFSGAEIMYVDAASFFQEKGCELTVLATAEELGEYAPSFEKAGYKILHYPMPPLTKIFSRMRYYWAIVKLLKNQKYEVVHIHSSAARWGFSLCAWVSNVRSVYTFHSVFPTRNLTYSYHILLRWSSKNIFKCRFQTISDTVHDHELKLYLNETNKIYNWYGNNRYYPAKEGEKVSVRKELGIDDSTFVVISVGGCNSNKRHSDIIKAVDIIQKEIPNSLYLHLGSGISEPEEKKLVNGLGINKNIRFCGNQIDVRKYLIISDVYFMTSCFEGISITTVEAMACKIPTILYNVPGLRDFNKYGNHCILIKENHVTLAEEAIKIYNSPKHIFLLTERANLMVNNFYNMQNNASKIYELYL